MLDCVRRAVSGFIMQKKKPVRPDGRAGFRAVWGSIIFRRGEFFQRLGDGLALLHLVNAPAQGFHVGRLIEWLGRVFRAGLLPVGPIVWGCGCCTASSVGGWVSDLGRVGVRCVCPGMPPGGLIVGVRAVLGVLLPVLRRGGAADLCMISPAGCVGCVHQSAGRVCAAALPERGGYVGLGFFPTSSCSARGHVYTGPLLARAAFV